MTRNPLPRCWHLWRRRPRRKSIGSRRVWWRSQCDACWDACRPLGERRHLTIIDDMQVRPRPVRRTP